jgi:4-amino-4-deoxy-L-arabinose transferase-like glycosyltransferase
VERHAYPLVVSGAVLGIVAANLVWISLDARPPHWDMAGHMTRALWYADHLAGGHPLVFVLGFQYYPPLVYWVGSAFHLLLGEHVWVAVLSNVVFIAALGLFTYGVGSRLWSRGVGFLAAITVLCLPIVVSQSREFMLDVPLVAVTVAALYFLVRTEEFTHRPSSVLFGVACGLGMLTKWPFFIALLFPAAAAAAYAVFRSVRERAGRRLTNIVLAGVAAYVVVVPWYLHNLDPLRTGVTAHTSINPERPFVGQLYSPLYYVVRLVDPQLYLVPSILFLVGLALTFARREALRRNAYPLLLILGTYVGYTLMGFRDARYTLPMLPAVALVAVFWIQLLAQSTRRIVGGAVVLYSVAMFYVVSFGVGVLPERVAVTIGSTEVALFAQRGYITGPPDAARWYQEEIFLDARRFEPRAPSIWYAGPSTIWFNVPGLDYYSRRYDVAFAATPEEATYLAVRGAEEWSPPEGFEPVRRVALPDGTVLATYRRAEDGGATG